MSSSASGALRLAEEYLARGDVNEALSIYRVISEAEPANLDIRRRLEELCTLAENMNSPVPKRDGNSPVHAGTGAGRARSLAAPGGIAPVERAESGCGEVGPAFPGSEATNDAVLVGKLAAAEILFGFGRSDRAIALLEELRALNPSDPRVKAKLKDMCLRSGIPEEPASAYRQPSKTDEAISEDATLDIGRSSVGSEARSRTGFFGPRHQGTRTNVEKHRRSRYLVAVMGLVAVSGTAAGYLLIRSIQANNIRPIATAQAEPVLVESPTADTVAEPQAEAAEESGKPVGPQAGRSANQSDPDTSHTSTQRQAESTREPHSISAAPDGAPAPQNPDLPKPTPPAVNPIAAIPSTTGGGTNAAPGALAADAPAAAPPPVPAPTVRRAAVMGGGEVIKRVAPVYPPAARAAHIAGTVTVELSINEQGKVVSARASSGPAMLTLAAELAARGFRFTPITLDGVPVKSTRTVLFHFKE